MDLKPWYPVSTLGRLLDGLLDLMEVGPLGMAPHWQPAPTIAAQDLGAEVILRVELGAVDPKSLRILINPYGATLSGEHRVESTQQWEGGMDTSRFYGKFSRYCEFPAAVDQSKATATLRDGYLEIRAPKAQRYGV